LKYKYNMYNCIHMYLSKHFDLQLIWTVFTC
jgi:hypothetical protein